MAADLHLLFTLLVVFQIKHYLCDFPLQVRWMLQKVNEGWSFFVPLAVHCLVHAAMTLLIVFYYAGAKFWWLAIVDWVAHFVMDRIKAGPKYLGRFRDRDKSSYWNALGFDQMIHHITSFYIVWVIISNPN